MATSSLLEELKRLAAGPQLGQKPLGAPAATPFPAAPQAPTVGPTLANEAAAQIQPPQMDTLGAQPFNPSVTPPVQNLGVPAVGPSQAAPPTLDPNQEATFDFSGLPNISDTELSPEAFGNLSPTAQGSIIPDRGVVQGQPTFQGLGGVVPNAQEGLQNTIDPGTGGIIAADPISAGQLNAQESQLQRDDTAAQQAFLSSPEGQAFSNRQIQAAQAPTAFDQAGIDAGTRAGADGTFAAPRNTGGPDSRDQPAGGSKPDFRALARAKGATGSAVNATAKVLESQFDQTAAENALAARKQEFAEGGGAETALENKINTIIESTGTTRSQATGLATGTTKVVNDPVTGRSSIVDLTTGEATPIAGMNKRQIPDFNVSKPAEGMSLFDRAGETTGAIQSGLRTAQGVTGQLGIDVASDESIQSQQDFQTAQNDLVRAFRESGRFTAAETKLLREELDISPGVFKDKKTFENKLKSIDRSLSSRFRNATDQFLDPDATSDEIKEARSKMRAMVEFRTQLGVPQEGQEAQAAEESAAMPEGINAAVTQDIWDAMTPEEQSVFN